MSVRTTALAAVATIAMSASALAVPISAGSNIDFTGAVTPIGSPNSYTATGADFLTSGSSGAGTAGTVTIANTSAGAFMIYNAAACPSFNIGGCGLIKDLVNYAPPSTLTNPAVPVTNFITFSQGANNSTFLLTSFNVINTPPSGSTLGTSIISGFGILTLNAFDPTPGQFTITIQGDGATTYSGSIVASAVPEPASMALLGAGMVGFNLMRRRQA
jgi:hypothetical protein